MITNSKENFESVFFKKKLLVISYLLIGTKLGEKDGSLKTEVRRFYYMIITIAEKHQINLLSDVFESNGQYDRVYVQLNILVHTPGMLSTRMLLTFLLEVAFSNTSIDYQLL